MASRPKEEPVATGWGPRGFRLALAVAAAAYYAMLFVASDCGLSERVPGPVRFFAQAACLFPEALETAIEYRAEVWSCRERKFVPFDPRPDFPIRAEDKESRFQRLGHFYRRIAPVMEALDAFLVERHNARAEPVDGVDGPIGGMRFLSLRMPIPAPGQPAARYVYDPLGLPPPGSEQKPWFMTAGSTRAKRCEAAR